MRLIQKFFRRRKKTEKEYRRNKYKNISEEYKQKLKGHGKRLEKRKKNCIIKNYFCFYSTKVE